MAPQTRSGGKSTHSDSADMSPVEEVPRKTRAKKSAVKDKDGVDPEMVNQKAKARKPASKVKGSVEPEVVNQKPKARKPAAKAKGGNEPEVVNQKTKAKKPASKVKGSVEPEAVNQKPKARKPAAKAKGGNEPDVVNQKLKAIAQIEDKFAAAYADETTPGGLFPKVQAKKGSRHPQLQKGKDDPIVPAVDATDDSDFETWPETDVEGTVQKKGTGRVSRSYREAIQAIRNTPLDLNTVTEDEESGAVAASGGQGEEEMEDIDGNNMEHGGKGGDNGYGEREEVGVGMRDPWVDDNEAVKEAKRGRPGEKAKAETTAKKNGSGVNAVESEGDEIGEVTTRKGKSVAEDGEDINMKDVDDIQGGENAEMEQFTIKDKSEDADVWRKGKGTAVEISSSEEDGNGGGIPRQKGKGQRRARSTVEDEDLEMHDIAKRPSQSSKRQRNMENESGSDSEKSIMVVAPPRKKSRPTETAQPIGGTPQVKRRAPVVKEQFHFPQKNVRSNMLVVDSDDNEITPIRPKKVRAASKLEEKRGREGAARGDKGKKGKEVDPAASQQKSKQPKAASQMISASPPHTSRSSEGQHTRATSKGKHVKVQAGESDSDNSSNRGKGNDDDNNDVGGLSDHDEVNGDERRFALESPIKGKARLTSKALVKVENEDYEKKPRSRVTNKDLPSVLTTNDVWTKKIVPTLIRWVAAQANPWAPAANHLEGAIRLIGRHYVGGEYDLESSTSSPEFQLAIQRLSDAWRNPIKNAALWAVIGFFDSNEKYFNESNEERQKWASEALNEHKFTFGFVRAVKVRGKRQLIKERPFQNNLILHTFTAHFAAIKKTSWVEGLTYDTDALLRAALALATAAVEWALMLWTRGFITVDKVRAAEHKATKGKIPKIEFSPKKNRRGSETTAYVAFSASEWNTRTLQYLKSIKKLTAEDMRTIMGLSRELVKSRDNASPELDEEDEDSRGCLAENTFNTSEIETDNSGDEAAMFGWGDSDAGVKDSSGRHNSKAGPSKKPVKQEVGGK